MSWFLKQPRWLQIVLINLIIILLLVGYVFWPESPDLRGLENAGDPYDALIRRDTWGVPHISGQTDADAAYGLAFAHAEDDFMTIQQSLAASRGQLAEIYGQSAAPADYFAKLLRIQELLDEKYESDLTPETRAMLDGYAAGLNHYAALHPDEVLGVTLFPVAGRDVAAGFVHKTPLFFGLDNVLGELFAEERQRPVSTEPVTAGPPRLRLPAITYFGSNTFSIAPDRSENGETFLAVNSHQPWTGAVAWYEAHVHSEEGWDAAGGLFPGTPIILMGHNRDLGWSMTVNKPDLVDVFVLEVNPDNPNQYLFDGEWRDFEVREEEIRVKVIGRFYWTVRQEMLWSVYGPAVRQPHGTYAIRYAGMEEVGLVEQWYQLNKAANFDEWQNAMREGPLPSFNVGYADKEGNIYYLYNAKLPLRSPNYDWEQYLPGTTSETLWTEYLPFDELPQVLNPSTGFVQNANSTPFETTAGDLNPDPAQYPVTFGIEEFMTNRALRMRTLIEADESLTAEEIAVIKFDLAYDPASDVGRIVEMLLSGPRPTEPLQEEAIDFLAEWDLVASEESIPATIGLLTLYYLVEQEGVEIEPSELVDGLFTEEQVFASLELAVEHLYANFGRVDIPWGRVNRLLRGETDLPLGGGPDLLHAIYGEFAEDGRLSGIAGDTYIMLVTWDADGNVSSQSVHQFGSATLDEGSPHFDDQAPLFAARQLRPVWLDEADIRANLSRAYRPGE